MLSALSPECTSEATLHCGSAPLNAAPRRLPHDAPVSVMEAQAAPDKQEALQGVGVKRRRRMKTAFDMCLSVTSGRPR